MVLLALGLLQLDQEISARQAEHALPWWLFVDSSDAARTMLGALASAMLTVATLAFSILMVAVVQTANAYSPRILREYLADTGNQHVLGILIGTFLYTLLVLRRVEDVFIPMVASSVALLLSLVAVVAFVYFINHVAHSIEVSSMVVRIYEESEELLDRLFPRHLGQPWRDGKVPDLPKGEPFLILTTKSGYIEAIASDPLLKAVTEADAVLRLERMIGDYVLEGTPLGSLWPAENADEALQKEIQGAIVLGKERTMVEDLLFGVRQLSDVALRALSPAVNDPATAVRCINALGSLLADMARLPDISPYRCDQDGHLRVIAPGATFSEMINLAFSPIRSYAAADLVSLLRLIEICTELSFVCHKAEQREALWQHVSMVARAADRNIVEPWDCHLINQRLREAAAALEQDPEQVLLKVEQVEPERVER
ncbi:MAG: DUF2254 domain-containing protein [Chloroflexota bacterium]|nr:DUF2254 domain-containing protein [Chloroflexota bacterium]